MPPSVKTISPSYETESIIRLNCSVDVSNGLAIVVKTGKYNLEFKTDVRSSIPFTTRCSIDE